MNRPYNPMERLERIIHSGDVQRIATTLDEETIREQFGIDSFEYLAYEQRQAELINQQRQGDSVPRTTEKPTKGYYQQQRCQRLPGMTENPAKNYGMLRQWLREYYRGFLNEELPQGFYRKNKKELRKMFYDLLRDHGNTVDDIVPRHRG